MASLSVIIITKNESRNIVACLESVCFADEIIILDSGSTDQTLDLARPYTSKIYQVDWPGYGIQKNRALQKAQCDWILSIDADEIVSEGLKEQILHVLHQENPSHDAYSIPRRSKYCSTYIRYGDWKNDRCVRLFKRLKAQFKELHVHEELAVQGTIGFLHAFLLHNSYNNLEDVLFKLNNYSTLSATQKFERGKKATLCGAILRGIWTFVRGYFLKLGFLDGQKGFMLAVSNAESCYYRYLKLMLLVKSQTQGGVNHLLETESGRKKDALRPRSSL